MNDPQDKHERADDLWSEKYDPRTQVRIHVGVQRGEYFMQASCVLPVVGRHMLRVMNIPPNCKDDARNLQICEDLIRYNLAQDMIHELNKYMKRGGKPEEESA